MILHKLNLANYRAFEQIEIEFDPDVTVIAGVNGVGKTAILDAIATILSRALPEFTEARNTARSFNKDDILIEKPTLEVSGILSVGEHRCHGIIQRVAASEQPDQWYLLLERFRAENAQPSELDIASQESRAIFQGLRTAQSQPIAVLFSPGRLLGGGKPQKLHVRDFANKTRAYDNALEKDRPVYLREFMEWVFTQQELSKVRTEQDELESQEEILEAFSTVVSDFLPDFSNVRVVYDPKPRFLVDKKGITLQLNQLSDGERGLLAIMFDITKRLAVANPHSQDTIHEGNGIVLIDEIELHLHPKWQRHALRKLKQTFQNCQFIVTTHSPQVIGQVRPDQLVLLTRNEQNRVEQRRTGQSFGMDSSWILSQIMDSPSRDLDTEYKLQAVFDAVDEEDLVLARRLAVELEQEVGVFPELQEVRSTIDRLELLGGT